MDASKKIKTSESSRSVAASARGLGRLFEVWIAAAFCLWAAGVTMPVLLVTKFYFFEDVVDLTGATKTLLAEGETLLAAVVFIFTLLFPIVKLLGLWAAYRLPMDWAAGRIAIHLVDWTGKWSMLDVFVVALVVVMLKGSWVADAETGPGLYCFFGAVLLTMLATLHLGWLQKQTRKTGENSE